MTQEEFKEEARRLRPKLLEVARRYLGDEDAEDTVQDALLRLWQLRGQLRLPLDALASVITRNLCVSLLRKRRATLTIAGETLASDDSPADSPDERIARMMGVVEQLPPLQQTILRLRHMEGMEMAQIAALTGSSEVALRKALSRARQSVRQQYLKQYGQ